VVDASEKQKLEVQGTLSCGQKVESLWSFPKAWRVRKVNVRLTLGWYVGMSKVDLLTK
jgi:hypothetical protein